MIQHYTAFCGRAAPWTVWMRTPEKTPLAVSTGIILLFITRYFGGWGGEGVSVRQIRCEL